MKNVKLIGSAFVAAAFLAGCGGSSNNSSGGGSGDIFTNVINSFTSCNTAATICKLAGTVNADTTLANDGTEWRLDGVVQVGEGNGTIADLAGVAAVQAAGVTLTIEPGVSVLAEDDAVLLVTRGSRLIADGTAANPITFSSLADADFDGLGEWGGVVIQGFAPQFGAGNTGTCVNSDGVCNVAGEGGSFVGNFGGNSPSDNSGVIRYVRIAEGGLIAGPNNEINGLTLQGVGYGTTIEYVQVHNNLDDGIEWFGGTVNVKYAVLTGNDDDDIDFDEGFVGNIQYAIIRKSDAATPQGSNDPRGIEANSSDEDYVPQTQATLANITIIGNNVNNAGAGVNDGEPGMRLRGAVTANVFNTAVVTFNNGCVRIDGADDDNNGATAEVDSVVTLTNVLGDCARYFRPSDEATATVTNSDNVAGGLTFNPSWSIIEGDAVVAAPAIPEVGASAFTFDDTTFVGAVDPAVTTAAAAWWNGWIIPGSL